MASLARDFAASPVDRVKDQFDGARLGALFRTTSNGSPRDTSRKWWLIARYSGRLRMLHGW
jgi:hypothetical protein